MPCASCLVPKITKMLTTLKSVLIRAKKGRYAVGAFNTSNLEISQAIIEAAEEMKSPVIISTSEKAIDYAGLSEISAIVYELAQKVKVPVVLHCDHGRDLKIIKSCLDTGRYTSVMIDASHFDYKKNLALTKKIVSWAKPKQVSVEAELGAIAGVEDYIKSKESFFTDPEQARDFVKKTGIDALAVSIGTAHGLAEDIKEEKLDLKRLEQIEKLTKIPLVLHGASQGIPVSDLKKAIKLGIAKINIDTDLRLVFSDSLRKTLKNKKIYDPRDILAPSREAVKKKVMQRMRLFGSINKY